MTRSAVNGVAAGNARAVPAWLAGLLVLLLIAACEEPNTYVPPPPPKVTVATPMVTEVTDYLEFTGTTRASAYAEVPARVPGVLQRMHFEPGVRVEAGDLLFEIDPLEYEAQVQVAEASLEQAKARLLQMRQDLARAQELLKTGNIPRARYDEAVANYRAAQADVKSADATLAQARINLGYTKVIAPISGRVGRNFVDVGNLVGQGEATILTDITAYDPMHVYFDLNERDLLRILTQMREEAAQQGRTADSGDKTFFVEMGLANEEGSPHQGVVDYSASGVDPETGTLQIRGEFRNEGRPPPILPGLFARVRVPVATRADMPLVTERAIGFDQTGAFVLVVVSDNVVEKRNVQLGQLVNGLRVIEDGLGDEEPVVVRGVQRARPGAPVEPEKVDMATLTASALKKAAEETKKQDQTSEKGGADAAAISNTDLN